TVDANLSVPQGVAVDQSGNVFIADTLNNRVVEVPVSGTPGTLGNPITVVSGLNAPTGLAADNQGHVFVTSGGGVYEFTPTASFTSLAPVASGLNQPYGVALDSQGDLFIADSANNQVVEVPVSGGSFGTPFTVVSGLNDPKGVAVDSEGDLYIAETGK